MIDQARTRPATPDGPTTEPGFVWVFQYVYWDELEQAHKTSKRYATLDVIKCGLGQTVTASGKKIAITKLIDGAFAD
jgi:hypothetical protein